jgi:hypothetical protein
MANETKTRQNHLTATEQLPQGMVDMTDPVPAGKRLIHQPGADRHEEVSMDHTESTLYGAHLIVHETVDYPERHAA